MVGGDNESGDRSLQHDYARVIKTKETWHLGYWASRFQVSVPQLLAAIREVGPDPERVEQHLKG